jgi:hypothetical protein
MFVRIRRHPRLAALAGYVVLAAAATWPLLARFTTEMGGGDAGWQTLWGLWWWHRALAGGSSPFSCEALRWSTGVPMWFQAWDVPSALALLPLWPLTPHLPEVAIYNTALFLGFPLAGFTFYLLCRELWGGELGPFLAGAIYTFSAYHFAHALGHLHLASMEWSPLYFLGLARTVRRHGALAPLLAGVALALSAAASFYHLAFCALGTIALVPAWLPEDRATILTRSFLRRALLLGGTFLLLAGWLLVGAARALRSGPYARVGDAVRGSADLLSFFVPGAVSAWRVSPGFGGAEADAAYVGYVALALAGWALFRARAVRPWLLVAAVGSVLALGPFLQVAGRVHDFAPLPYGWLERAVPALRLADAPARFSWLVTFGVAVAAGAALSALVRAGRRGPLLASLVAALALVETWPHAFATSSFPAPRFLRDLARDDEGWAVLDASGPSRRLWHQVLHGHPQVGGSAPPAPERLERLLREEPALRRFYGDGAAVLPREEEVRALQRMDVRFVIADEQRLREASALRLPLAFQGDGIAVFEVPPRLAGSPGSFTGDAAEAVEAGGVVHSSSLSAPPAPR